MVFTDFLSAHTTVLWLVFGIALIMGAVVNKTNFCTMGAVSDLVNIGDSGRLRAWVFAMAVALIGVTLLEYSNILNVDTTRPPYRGSNFAWLEYVLGGVMFGVGMTLGSGCGNKTLIRIGGGNIKSILVLLIIGLFAYFMINPFPGTDVTIYSLLFYPWTSPASVSLTGKQDLGSIMAALTGGDVHSLRLWLGLLVVAVMLFFVFKSADFRRSFDNKLAGVVVGLCVLAAWYATGAFTSLNIEGESYSWTQYASDDVWSMMEEGTRPSGVAVQSYTFINPIGETLGYFAKGMEAGLLTFGVVAVFGVIAGSLLWSLLSRSFRIEWFVNFKDFITHVLGGVLMGIGGVLALGCTVGQAITGVSTLALGSFLAFASIVFGSALTMKIQYYKMVYEEDASFGKALLTSLVDMKLLPAGLRKLEAV